MRAKNIGKNSFFSVFSQVLIILAGFFSQRVINLKLGTELVGLNGVVSNVIAVFSVTELGLSTAIVFHLYRALADAKEEAIASLMNLYRKAYLAVAGVIAILGFGFLPFVHFFLRENHLALSYVRLIYALWVAKTVFGYLLSYKRSIVIADQREYISSLAVMAASILNYVSVIVIVMIWGKYEWALVASIVFEALINIFVILYVDKTYPYLKKLRKLPVEKKLVSSVFGDVKNLFVTRIAQKLLSCTDNLITSSFISLSIVGFYSNYCLITQSLINVLQALSGALQPTVGNLIVEGDKKRDEELLGVFTFAFFFLSAIVLCGVAGMASLFVGEIWLGDAFLLPKWTVFLCAVNCMLYVMLLPIGAFVSASGLFQFEKKIAMAAAVVNLVLSLAFVKPLGLLGVLLGTLAAYVILFVGKSYGFYKLHLEKGMKGYVLEMGEYVLLSLAEALVCVLLSERICQSFTIWRFFLSGMICVLLPGGLNFLLFGKSKRFGSLIGFLKRYKALKK